jgi:hypothetical protein
MAGSFYPILHIDPAKVVGDEQLGTKTKFWFERDGVRWLFKEAREITAPMGVVPTGEDWAEKVAAEIAHTLQISAAEVELAEFQGRRGCASRIFTNPSQQLMHGNEVLAGYVAGYDRDKRFRQSGHTLENIILAIRGMFPEEVESRTVLTRLASYLALDALIGNVDRHHENWGLLWQVRVEVNDFNETARLSKEYDVAPSFDHASSLGRELLDEKRGNLLRSGAVEGYVRKGRGGIYRQGEAHGANPLHLVALAARKYPDYFQPVLRMLLSVPLERLIEPLDRIPDERITSPARSFGKAMVAVAYEQLTKVAK